MSYNTNTNNRLYTLTVWSGAHGGGETELSDRDLGRTTGGPSLDILREVKSRSALGQPRDNMKGLSPEIPPYMVKTYAIHKRELKPAER